jgi:hypothetical protein
MSEWFNGHWRRTDGKFSRRNTFAYNANSVVVNAELLWYHFRYFLHATGRSAFIPSKASFLNALLCGGIELKHVKNKYVGSIRLAAAVRALPSTATCSGPVWHPSGSHLGLNQASAQCAVDG